MEERTERLRDKADQVQSAIADAWDAQGGTVHDQARLALKRLSEDLERATEALNALDGAEGLDDQDRDLLLRVERLREDVLDRVWRPATV